MRTEAVQIEAQAGPVPSSNAGSGPGGGEAKQDEAQASALGMVIRDHPNARLPATAWPRQTLAVTHVTHGDGDPPSAGNSGYEYEGRLVALVHGSSRCKGWWCRLGCRARSFLPRVNLSIDKSGVRGRDPPDEEITKTVISQEGTYE